MFLTESNSATAGSPLTPAGQQSSDADIGTMQRVLAAAAARPDLIPEKFMSYVLDYIQTGRLLIPIGQIFGFSNYTAQIDTQPSEAHFTSTSYADPNVSGPSGPTLSNLADGNYVVLWGAAMQGGTAETIFMGVSANSATVADTDALECQVTSGHVGSARGNLYSLSNGGTNTLSCKYKTTLGHDSDIRKAWLVAIKYANL